MAPSSINSNNDSLQSFFRVWSLRCTFVTVLCNVFLSMVLYLCIPQVYERTPITSLFLFLAPFLTSSLYYFRNSSLNTLSLLVIGLLFSLELLHMEQRVVYTEPNIDIFLILSRITSLNLTKIEGTDILVHTIVTLLFAVFLRSIIHAKGTTRLTSPYYLNMYSSLRHSIAVTVIFMFKSMFQWTILFSCVVWLLNILIRNSPSTVSINYHMIYYLVLPFVTMIRFVAVFHGTLVARPIHTLEKPNVILPVAASLSITLGAQTYDLLARRVAEILSVESDLLSINDNNAIAVQFGETSAETRKRADLFDRIEEPDAVGRAITEMTKNRVFRRRPYVPDHYQKSIPCLYPSDVLHMHTILSAISRSLYTTDWSSFSATFEGANNLAQEAQALSFEVTQGCFHYRVPPACLKDILPLHIYSFHNSCPGCLLYLFDLLVHTLLTAATRIGLGDARFYGGWHGYALGDKEVRAVKRLIMAIVNVQRKLYNTTATEQINDINRFFTDFGAQYTNATRSEGRMAGDIDNNDEIINDMIGLDFLMERDTTTGLMLDDAGVDFMMLNDGGLRDLPHAIHPALNAGHKQAAPFEQYKEDDAKKFSIKNYKFAFLMAVLVGRLSIEEIIKRPEIVKSYTLGALLRRFWFTLFDSLGSLASDKEQMSGKGFALMRLRYVFWNLRAVRAQQAAFNVDAEIAAFACDTLHDYLYLIENTSLFFTANEIIAESLRVLYSSLVMYRKKARISKENLGHSRRLMASLRLLADRVVVTSTSVN